MHLPGQLGHEHSLGGVLPAHCASIFVWRLSGPRITLVIIYALPFHTARQLHEAPLATLSHVQTQSLATRNVV